MYSQESPSSSLRCVNICLVLDNLSLAGVCEAVEELIMWHKADARLGLERGNAQHSSTIPTEDWMKTDSTDVQSYKGHIQKARHERTIQYHSSTNIIFLNFSLALNCYAELVVFIQTSK